MKKRLFIFSGFLFLMIGSANAQNVSNNPKNVMMQLTDSITQDYPRSIIELDRPTVTLSGSILTFDFLLSITEQHINN